MATERGLDKGYTIKEDRQEAASSEQPLNAQNLVSVREALHDAVQAWQLTCGDWSEPGYEFSAEKALRLARFRVIEESFERIENTIGELLSAYPPF